MPYFVYKIAPSVSQIVKNVEQLKNFEKFKDAKNFAKIQRQSKDHSEDIFKVIFAKSTLEAEELLQEQRDETIVREWEK